MLRSGNPTLNDKVFKGIAVSGRENLMTLEGTVNKVFALLAITVMGAMWTWYMFFNNQADVSLYMIGGAIGGFILALVTIFKKEWAHITSPVYAVLEGLFLGGISAVAEKAYPGIAIQAVSMTFGTLFCLLFAYRSGLIKPTENFKLGVVAATGAICLVYLVSFVLSFFGLKMSFLYGNGWLSIGISVFIVIIAALNLVLDFDFIENGVKQGAPKYMEWYAAFGLLVTLVWLYLEILRLLMKLRSRN